jgi:hypothetical protein
MTEQIIMTEQQLDKYNNKLLDQTINGINQAHQQASSKKLSQFTTPELEQELLHRQKCSFGRLSCTNQAQVYLIKPQQPACFNCQQDVLILSKEK